MINKPVVNHPSLPISPRARPAAGYHPYYYRLTLRRDLFLPPCVHDLGFPSRAMNFAGIAVLTEPDASRAPRIIGCIRCSEDRSGVTHLLPATIAIPHPSFVLRREVPSLFHQIGRFACRPRNRERVIALFCSSIALPDWWRHLSRA